MGCAQSYQHTSLTWTSRQEAYLREGVALQHLGQHGDALAAFAAGLVQEPANAHLLAGLKDTALKSPLKDKFQATFQQLEKLRLVRSPFVLMAVVGQELLAACHYSAAVSVLEAALQVGTCSLKLRGSVFSALASAHWGLGALDKALYYMQQDLAVTKSLGDQDGECRAYGNLGSAFFTKGQYKESLTHHRFQLVLAMRLRQRQTAGSALSSLGHVYTAIGDYPNALASHKQCVLLLKQGGDKISEAREIGNVGAVYLAMGNFNSAVECHQEHLKIARALKSPVEEARALSNLGSAYHYKRDYMKAMAYHKEVLKIAEQRHDRMLEARAYAGLGHAARCASLLHQAQFYHEKQLDNALQTKDRVAEGRACANLGIIYHQLGEYDAALKLHKKNLEIARSLADKASQGRAYGNMGNAYSSLGKHEQAVRWHKQALTVSTEVGDFQSQGSTHGNLAVAYQSLGMYESALQHYVSHLNVARELKDLPSEARALCNLGNFHCARGDFPSAVSLYEQFLVLSRELRDAESESKACFNLGYVHFNMGNFTESERYYEQDLAMARKRRDRLALARAYCNLGLAQKSLGKLEESLECQKKCLRLMETLKITAGKFRALGNIGDLMLKMGDMAGAVRVYNQQLVLAQQAEDQDLMASSLGALGNAHRLLGQHDKALSCHTQELTLRQEKADLQGECRAHGHLGNVHTSMGNYHSALKYYQEMLDRSRDIGSHKLEGQACGNLGITRMNMGQLEEAIGFFEQQLAMLEQQTGPATLQDKVRAFSNLGDCYEALGDFEEAVKWHEQCLILAQQLGSLADQDKAYRGLGNAHKAVGNLQQALVCFEKRLYVAHQLSSCAAKASAYGELGCLHSLLGNFEQAVSCLEQQLGIAREMGDKECEGDAACGLGGVYQQMCEYETALKYHGMDLHIAEVITSKVRQCRAYGNLGLSHESLGNYKEAVKHQEQHLSIAAEMNDRVAKTLAYSSLGRVHQALGHHTQAVQYLQQGLTIAEQLRRREDEAKIRHRLGLALWGSGNLEECQKQMNTAADLFETIRRESQCSSEYKLSLFDLQTACYQALQRVLVTLGRPDEALVVAERACTRAFIDLLLERQAGSAGLFNGTTMDLSPITIDQMTATVAKQKALVLCFSVAAGSLYTWLLSPKKGLVKFHELSLWELENDTDGVDTQSLLSVSSTSLLDHCVGQVRESMGIETHIATTSSGHRSGRIQNLQDVSDAESDANSEVFQQQLEELGGRLNAESDRTGFLAMINRAHTFNSSAVSLGSVLSLPSSSLGLSLTPQRQASFKKCGGRSPLSTLYQCLMAPMEEAIAQQAECQEEPQDLVLVLQGDLYLIPFLMLRAEQAQRYLFERFNLIIVPSISALNNTEKLDSHGRPLIASSGALVVGNPQLTPSICQHWHLKEIPGAEYEARILGELLSCRPLIGSEATKGAVLHQVEQVEVIHFATHISWKLSSIVLSPGEFAASTSAQHFPVIDSDDSASDVSPLGGPSLSEYLLTAADILNLRLHAKLVVLNSGYTDDRAGRVNTDGVVGLTRALLSAGAQCVLFSLWPVPDAASKLLMRTLYSALQEGQCITQALSKAVKTVQSTKQFSHPANWGGWVVVGQDVRLASKVALMSHSLGLILQTAGMCREILRVLLHLMEKSLQRIQQGARNPMYTTVQSVENKVGAVPGWKELLQAVGFRFEPATAGLPPAVFFPQSDPGDRLAQASGSLQALLGLPPSSLTALSKFVTSCDVGEALIQGIREILSKLSAKEAGIDMVFSVQLWHVSGCHEFLASLGLDLVAVGSDNVTLRLSKQAVRRHLQFALQALVSVFNTHDAPHLLSLDNSSSMESLSSCHSASSPSTPSLSSPTPTSLSHYARGKRSIFNPAEMERMRNFRRQDSFKQGGSWDGQESSSPTSLTRSPVQMDPAMCLSHQNRIRSLYGSSSTCDSPSSDTRPSSLPSPFQDSTGDADSIQSCDGPESQPVARCSIHESGVTKSVKFAEQLVREQVFDPASPKSNSGSDSEGAREAGRKASQLHHHFEQHAQHRRAMAQCTSKVSNELLLASRSVNASTHVTLSERKEEAEQKAGKKTSESPGLWPDGKIDPEDIVQKVLADVASQQAEVERLQQQSAALSFERAFKMRAESNKSSQPFLNSLSGSSHLVTAASPRTVPACEDQKSSNTMAEKSLRKTVDRESQLPPPYPSPPSYNKQCVSSSLPPQTLMPTETRSQVGGGAHPRVTTVHPGCQTGENSISSDNSEGADSNVQSSVSSGYHSESSHNAQQVTSDIVTHPHTDRGLFTKDFVNQSSAGAFPQSLSTSSSSFESLSSFRPYHPSTPLVYTNALHNRPESSNSLSSQYSTSSSNRSVIYRPLGDGRIGSIGRQKQDFNPFLQPKHKSPTAISGLFDGSFLPQNSKYKGGNSDLEESKSLSESFEDESSKSDESSELGTNTSYSEQIRQSWHRHANLSSRMKSRSVAANDNAAISKTSVHAPTPGDGFAMTLKNTSASCPKVQGVSDTHYTTHFPEPKSIITHETDVQKSIVNVTLYEDFESDSGCDFKDGIEKKTTLTGYPHSMSADSNNHSVKTNKTGVLFLDSEHRIIAKSNVLQSSKC
ncbi:tetratricopeptide repeat protein 28-like isoform X2 [Pomacea canaliculata]|uniref:tetratricopeptide repeat protein 28-like isoform X2 n=1 Tax=Pomacea canaliculata TaxID=400727 RepID=UPI000D73DA7E|nr:tetratricopeptide repeat protein 28-like isoform X2 [Pomacea canaliculata]